LDDAASDIARAFDIHDFYTAHIMNYCEGYYEPNTTVTREQHPSENVTYCSNRTTFFHFDPTAIIQSELASGVNLTDLHWPSQIEDATKAVEVASKIMFIFYCIGIGFAGLALIGAAWGVLANGRISAFVNFTLDIVSPSNLQNAGKMTRHTLPTTVRRRAGESNPSHCLLLPRLHTMLISDSLHSLLWSLPLSFQRSSSPRLSMLSISMAPISASQRTKGALFWA
jgi:hypothetical protein